MKIKAFVKKLTPHFLLDFYHYLMALAGALIFWFPSKELIVIGITGTSGKSTTVDFISRILEEAGSKVASISSVRFKIGKKEWKNQLKMTMPGRFFIQRFLRQALREGCEYTVLEVTSEGIKQFRHKFINFDTAVFTNLSLEHIESHGSFENYRKEKLKLFETTKNVHIINIDDKNAGYFLKKPANKKITFGLKKGDFNLKNTRFKLNLLGVFNYYNAMAAVATTANYGISFKICKEALKKVSGVPGRMEIISKKPLVVVDYAHTPEQLELAYKSLGGKNLICVLGSCGGGRDKWKRPVLGKIAKEHCKAVIVTNEDPYDEDPMEIINQVAEGVGRKAIRILYRREAIEKAVKMAKKSGKVIITGKGSEPLMCLENGKKIPWDDREIVKQALIKKH